MKNRDFDILQVKTHKITDMYTFRNNKEIVVHKNNILSWVDKDIGHVKMVEPLNKLRGFMEV